MFYRIKTSKFPVGLYGLRAAFLLLGLLFLFAIPAQPDSRKRVSNLVATLVENLDWQQFNQVWIFRPRKPDSAVYLHIYNRNVTSAHTFTVQIYQTPSNTISDWTNNQGLWQELAVQGTCSPIPANTTNSCFVNAPLGGQLAIRFTGAVTAAGTPDTADIFIVQATPGVFPAAVLGESPIPNTSILKDGTVAGEADVVGPSINPAFTSHRGLVVIPLQTIGSSGGIYQRLYNAASVGENEIGTNFGTTGTNFINPNGSRYYQQKGADPPGGIVVLNSFQFGAWGKITGQAYTVFTVETDPLAGVDILNLNKDAATAGSELFLENVVVSSTAAFELHLQTTTANGVTCTDLASSVVNLHADKTVTDDWDVTKLCTTDPVAVGTVWRGWIPANETITIPLPVKAFSSDQTGISASPIANVTGTVTIGYQWVID